MAGRRRGRLAASPRRVDPLKILHVVADCNPAMGGISEGVLRLGEAYRALGHEQHLLTLDLPGDPWVIAHPSPIAAMGSGGIGDRVYPRRAIAWLQANASHYDGIIVDGLWNAATLTARLALPGSASAYAVFPHGMLDPWFRQLQPVKERVKRLAFRANEGPLLRAARAVLFTSEQERVLARESWPGWRGITEKVVGFGAGEPPQSFHVSGAKSGPMPGIMEGQPYLLFMSRIHPKKGLDILLQAYAASRAAHTHRLVIAGPGDPAYIDRLVQQARCLGIADRIHWPGMVTGETKWQLLRNCAALTLVSHQENFGVVVAEACACGTPVIVSDQVNIHADIAAASAGLVCSPAPRSATAALDRFARSSEGERAAMAKNARQLYEDRYAMTSVARRVLEIFQ